MHIFVGTNEFQEVNSESPTEAPIPSQHYQQQQQQQNTANLFHWQSLYNTGYNQHQWQQTQSYYLNQQQSHLPWMEIAYNPENQFRER